MLGESDFDSVNACLMRLGRVWSSADCHSAMSSRRFPYLIVLIPLLLRRCCCLRGRTRIRALNLRRLLLRRWLLLRLHSRRSAAQ